MMLRKTWKTLDTGLQIGIKKQVVTDEFVVKSAVPGTQSA